MTFLPTFCFFAFLSYIECIMYYLTFCHDTESVNASYVLKRNNARTHPYLCFKKQFISYVVIDSKTYSL